MWTFLKKFLGQRVILFKSVTVTLLLISLATIFVAAYQQIAPPNGYWAASQEEVRQQHLQLINNAREHTTQVKFIKRIAERYGGEYTLQILIDSTPRYGADKHLLGHYAGDKLYEERGLEAMRVCTPDLWYACAHSVVIGALFEQGTSVLEEIHDICATVEGPNGYRMCFHGFGHGVIAYAQYSVPDAVELCLKLGKPENNNIEAIECFGGVVMDLRDGLHDRDLWERYGKQYIPEDNPAQLCTAHYVPELFSEICNIYITPFLFDAVGTRNIPNEPEIAAALALCEELDDTDSKRACYKGFPKELILYLHTRDVSAYINTTDEEFQTLYSWCNLSQSNLGIDTCVRHMVNAIDRNGTHPYELTLRYCALVPEASDQQNACYEQLIYSRWYANIPSEENRGLCQAVPAHMGELCQSVASNI